MFRAASLLTTLLLSISIAASPVEVRSPGVRLPLAKYINTNGGAINLVKHDQARAAALKERGFAIQNGRPDRRSGTIDVTNKAVSYVALVGVGSPATKYNLIVDTGSSNTWVGADSPYTATGSSQDTGEPVSVSYGSGSFSSEEWIDIVTLASHLVIDSQSIGVANASSGLEIGFDGILGLGPVELTLGTLTSDPSTEILTVVQNLYEQGTISQEVVSVFFAPPTSVDDTNGELTFGGTDSSKFTGHINYTPVTSASPASHYWGIDQSITYGDKTILAKTAGIVDTGTTLILIASDAYSAYQSTTGATADEATGLLSLTTSQYRTLRNLNFNVGSVTYALVPNGQIWPRSLNSYIGGSSGSIYSIIGDLGTQSGEGLDFMNGQSFLERFYSVYDTTNQQVGLTTTHFTKATSN